MTSPTDAADRYPAAAYFALTIALSWGVWLPTFSVVEGPVARFAPIPGAFGLFALVLVARYGPTTLAAGAAHTPTWAGDQPGRRSTEAATGVET